MVFVSLLLITGGLWLVSEPQKFISNIFIINNPNAIRFLGIAGIVFFGLAGIYGIIKLFDKKAGLIIDSSGITDNTSAVSIGLIEWSDILGIRTEQIMSTKFLLIDVENPKKYLDKAKNGMKKNL